jgi:hypothetical protein
MNVVKKLIDHEDIGQSALFPVGVSLSRDEFSKLATGEILSAEIRQGRNARFMAKYWAMAQLTADNSSTYDTKDKIHVYVCVKAGWVDTMIINGKVIMSPRSISFGKCSEKEFSDFYEKAVVIMADLLQCSVSDLEKNYHKYL